MAPTGVPWSVWVFWDPGWAFRQWYVNLEDVHRRGEGSVVTQDHVLDVLVSPDRAISLKDEDELRAAVASGRWGSADAARFYRDAEDVAAVVSDRGSPFCDGWENWRPESDWPAPELPRELAESATYR